MTPRSLLSALAVAAAVATTAAAQQIPPTPSQAPAQASSAATILQALGGSNVTGTLTFTQRGTQITVTADIRGLRPAGHGFHIHERGDCSAPDGSSAGGHFNPTNKPHGNPTGGDHHAGDLPMLTADASGNARLTTEISGVTLDQGATGIVGRAIIVHVDPDDYTTQPSGNSGGRIACGIIAAR